jgi:molecular chaperone GrpE
VWYENLEDETVQKADVGLEKETSKINPEAVAKIKSDAETAFPTAGDPTKAFEDDDEEASGDAASPDEIATLKSVIKELDGKASQNYNRYLRALAEMENYKKRMARERTELLRYAGEDLLREILPVVDNLERTLAHINETVETGKVMEGVSLIHKQFLQALEKSGVVRIEEAPCAFNPEIHQALQKVETKGVPDDTVVEILQKGYFLNGKVVRPAMVKVAKHP